MDNDNDWGNKKQSYYAKNKRDKEDSDYQEEEEEAIKIQQQKLIKMKQARLLDSDSEADEEDKNEHKIKTINKKPKKFNLDSSDEESDEKKKQTEDDIEENKQLLENIKNNIDELNGNLIPTLDIVDDMKGLKKYLLSKKDMHLLYTSYLLYYLYYKNSSKISDHHPILKKMLYVKGLLNGMKETDEKIFRELENVLQLIEKSGTKEDDEEEESEDEQDTKLLGKKTKKSILDTDLNDFLEDNNNKLSKLQNVRKVKKEKVKCY
jgi:hypothetical protein